MNDQFSLTLSGRISVVRPHPLACSSGSSLVPVILPEVAVSAPNKIFRPSCRRFQRAAWRGNRRSAWRCPVIRPHPLAGSSGGSLVPVVFIYVAVGSQDHELQGSGEQRSGCASDCRAGRGSVVRPHPLACSSGSSLVPVILPEVAVSAPNKIFRPSCRRFQRAAWRGNRRSAWRCPVIRPHPLAGSSGGSLVPVVFIYVAVGSQDHELQGSGEQRSGCASDCRAGRGSVVRPHPLACSSGSSLVPVILPEVAVSAPNKIFRPSCRRFQRQPGR